MGLLDRLIRAALPEADEPSIVSEPQPQRDAVPDDPNKIKKGAGRNSIYSTSALINAVTGIGTSRDPSTANEWAIARPLQRRELFGMGRNALIYQALNKLPSTATREGWRVAITEESIDSADAEAYSDQIAAYEERLGSRKAIARALFRGRQYADALVLLGIEDGRGFDQPVDKDNIQTIKWVAVIDRRDFYPAELYQADSQHFGAVRLFQITNINGVLEDGLRYGEGATSLAYDQLSQSSDSRGRMLVHADRVLQFPTADYLPLPDTLQDSLGGFFESVNGIRTAARESSTVVYKVSKWLRKVWSDNAGLAHAHMSFVDKAKGVLNAWVLDKDNEEVDITSRALGGVSQLADPFMVWLAAALATPVTVLWGVSPGGFGKGEAERETWHEEARAYQKDYIAGPLYKLHGYILVAKDGPQLPYDTERETAFADLSPPDEKVRSELRAAALEDATKAFEKGGMTRDEYRALLASLTDDYFRFSRTETGEAVTRDAPVGVFTGSLEVLKAAAAGEIPALSAQRLLSILAPSSFNPETAAEVFAPLLQQRPPAAPAAAPPPANPDAPTLPADEEDAEAEPSEIDILWSEAEPPADAATAKVLAEHADLEGVTARQITLLGTRGEVPSYKNRGFKRDPLYSLAEVKRALLERQGLLPAADAHKPDSVCLMFLLPPELARWVPWKAKDSSPPHVTLAYSPQVSDALVNEVIADLRTSLARYAAQLITFADEVAYFDQPDGRVAYVPASFAESDTLHAAAIESFAAFGLSTSEYDYTPHTTLAYLAPSEEYDGPRPRGSWEATQVEVWRGEECIARLDLLGAVTDAEAEAVRDPFANQHAARQRDPADFIKSTFRRKNIAPGVDIIIGKLKSDPRGSMVTQTYRFDASKFTPTQARKWLREAKVEKRALEVATERDAFDEVYGDHAWKAVDAAYIWSCDTCDNAEQERIDEAFAKYHEAVNMGAAELEAWAETEWSKKASVSREPIARNLRLLRKKKEDWTLADATAAMRTVSFVSRMRGAEQGEPVKIDGREGPSKRDISLKNWAFDPNK